MLVVEDGTIVAGANSYVDLVEARAYALARGVTLSTDDDVVEALAIQAKDYLESKRSFYRGVMVEPSVQELQWPREEAYIYGALWPSDSIPKELRYAQCQLIIELHNGVLIMPTQDDPFVIHEKVGAIETRYSDKVNTTLTPSMPIVDSWLAPITTSGTILSTVRI